MKTKNVFPGIFLFCIMFFRIVSVSAADPLTLDQVVKEARSKSLILKQAAEKIRAAEFASAEQRTYLFPSINLSGSNTYQKGDVLVGATVSGQTETDINSLSLGITQTVFAGGAFLGQYQISSLAVDLTRASYDAADLDLVLSVKSAYFSVLRQEKAVIVSRELVDNRQRHLSEVEKRVNVGILPKVEQLKAEVESAHSQDALILAENGLDAARSGLNRLLERPLDAELILEDVVLKSKPEERSPKYYYAEAQKNRPERIAAGIQVSQAEKGVMVARSGYFPQVSLGLSTEEYQADAFNSEWARNDQVLLTVSCDIWNWGRLKNRIRGSQSQLKQAQLALADLERAVNLEVKSAYLVVLSARSRIETAQKAVSQAEEVLRMQSIRFKEGMATNTEVLDADFALAQAKTDYYNAFYDYLSAEAGLEKSIGRRVE